MNAPASRPLDGQLALFGAPGARRKRYVPTYAGDFSATHACLSLRLLRDEGLFEFRRGRGILVAGTPELGAVVQRARELVTFARHNGYRVDELLEIIEDLA